MVSTISQISEFARNLKEPRFCLVDLYHDYMRRSFKKLDPSRSFRSFPLPSGKLT